MSMASNKNHSISLREYYTVRVGKDFSYFYQTQSKILINSMRGLIFLNRSVVILWVSLQERTIATTTTTKKTPSWCYSIFRLEKYFPTIFTWINLWLIHTKSYKSNKKQFVVISFIENKKNIKKRIN